MTSINSSSSSNATNKAYSSAGMSGLVSGLDTETMVKQMLASTQTKIDKQNALRQQTIWKQDAYRDIISAFHNFQNRFFNYLSPKTNLLSSTFFNTKAVTSSSTAVKVSVLGDVLSNKLTINNIQQLATARKESGANSVSGAVVLNVDASNFANASDLTVKLTLDGVTKEVQLSDAAIGSYAEGSKEAILQNLNNSIKKAFGSGFEVNVSTGEIVMSDPSRQVTITGGSDVQKILGFNGSASTKISLGSSISSLNLKTSIAGSKQKFTINGVDFEFDSSETFSSIMEKINTSTAGVRISYSALTDKFSIESTTFGKDINIEMSQSEGNLLTVMFGVSSGNKVTSNALYSNTISSSNPVDLEELYEGSFKLTVDGKTYTIAADKREETDGPYTLESLVESLNKTLNETFGSQYGTDAFAFVVNSGQVSLSVSNKVNVSIEATDGSLAQKLGFADDAKNQVNVDTTLGSIGFTGTINLNGVDINLTSNMKIDDLAAYGITFADGKLSITGNASNFMITGNDGLMKRFFSTTSVELNSTKIDTTVISAGSNAVFTVNGQMIERNSNDFNIDGYQISLQKTSVEEITLTAENNTEQIFDGIVQFVNEYNSLIEKINGFVTADKSYKEYPPLTSEQKAEMSEKEIELWEEKAKTGLLNGDSQLTAILNQMRTLMYSKPDGSSIALYDIGITTSSNFRDRGKLIIDEEKLRAAINQDPAQVGQLFTSKDGGLAVAFNKLVDQHAKSSIASPGTLVRLAGVKNTATEKKNSLYDRMEEIDKVIARLKLRYETEKTRYWKQFTALEKVVFQSNSQASWLMDMFGN